jgi:predicted metal-dependent HD superfamily phosphohydrolase
MTSPAEKKWLELWHRFGAEIPSDSYFAGLVAHYSEPHRAYHNLAHVMDCLDQFEPVRHLAQDAAAVEIAIWYHDVIYDPRAKDNEERSADIAAAVMDELRLPIPLSRNDSVEQSF